MKIFKILLSQKKNLHINLSWSCILIKILDKKFIHYKVKKKDLIKDKNSIEVLILPLNLIKMDEKWWNNFWKLQEYYEI